MQPCKEGCWYLERRRFGETSREGKLQETLKELKRLSETWKKMADKHESILASYASIKPRAADSIKAIIKKEKELTNTFERDVKQIEEYLARKGSLV